MITIKHKTKPDGRKWTVVCSEPEAISFDMCHYVAGNAPPHYPVPAIRPYNSWGNDTSYITIWPGVMQQRISDEPYTGFGKVITFDLVTGECETRYDDFD